MYKLTDLYKQLREETTETPQSQYKIYCDMDGVLTDFDKRFEQYGGMPPQQFEKEKGKEQFWNLIDKQIGVKFWAGMPWMPNGQALWNFISPYNPNILSSPSEDNSSRLGKRMWIRENLNPAPRKIIFKKAEDKQQHAAPNHILIDDKPSNIAQWAAAGGIALEVKDGEIQSVIQKLKELGYGKRKPIKKGV